jgi:dCTP deaminase
MIIMTVLSDVEIEECIKDGQLAITPFDQSCLNGAGYDLRVSEETAILPGHNQLVATLERVELNLARAGVIASLALVDPGYRGQLTILLFNSGEKAFNMSRNARFLQMTVHRLGVKTRRPYAGKYQDSQGIVDSRP